MTAIRGFWRGGGGQNAQAAALRGRLCVCMEMGNHTRSSGEWQIHSPRIKSASWAAIFFWREMEGWKQAPVSGAMFIILWYFSR